MADIAEESPAQKAARLRREKRNAKIQAEGNDRLARITQLSGRPAPAPEEPSMVTSSSTPAATTSTAPQNASVEDPDEVDISEHHWTPSDAQLARFQQQQQQQQPQQQQEDPMMRMMQQMLSGNPGAATDMPDSAMDDLPPILKAMMQGQRTTQQQAAATAPPTSSTYLWRIVHAVFALSLALHIAVTGTFSGSRLSSRSSSETLPDDVVGPRLFYIFATVEVLLQSTRYFVEKGRLQGSGWLATIANSGLVPEPWGGYVRVLGRYAVIWQTVVGDAMVVLFGLGVLAWWRGAGVV